MRHGLVVSSFILFSLSLSPIFAQDAASVSKRSLITQPIENQKRVTLGGNTRSAAITATDQGAVPSSMALDHMLLQLQRPAELSRALDQYLNQLQDPASPNYHHWLSAAEYGNRFGLAQTDIATVTNWLQSQGFVVNQVYANGVTIDFSGTAGQVRQAFNTEIHYLSSNGEQHIANMSDPQIPAALAPAVTGIASLHNFMPRPMKKDRVAQYTIGSGTEAVSPADLATIYNLNPLFAKNIAGQGQTIVVIEDTNVYSTNDWYTFRNAFGLSSYTSGSFTQTQPGNCASPGVVSSNESEAILDAEWASAAAPGAAIVLASCSDTSTTFGGLIALQNLLNTSTPPALVSISYGECEAENGTSANATYSAAYQQAVAEGVSVFVSSGDEGAASCDAGSAYATHGIGVSAFASTPYNVAVGGTDFGDTYAGTAASYWNTSNTSTYESAKSYIPEIPWDDSCANNLISSYLGYSVSYGSSGFCNSSTGKNNFLNITGGSGGPSGCATGSPSAQGIVGGTCQGYAKPSWQAGAFGNPSDGVRDIPDVSLFAANGVWGHYYIFCFSDTAHSGASCSGVPSTWSGAGGTSFSSPIMAGIQALVNQNTASRWGNPNPYYYSLAASEFGTSGNSSCLSSNSPAASCTFYDLTQGNMDVVCAGTTNCYGSTGSRSSLLYGALSTSSSSFTPAYATGNGWDFATGIGSVNANNLVANWNGSSSTSAATATYRGVDTSTLGAWTGKYGADGFQIANDSSSQIPSYAALSFAGAMTYTWANPTTDSRALQVSSGSSSLIASTYYSWQSSFQIHLNLTDGNTHQVGFYMVDWGYSYRSQTISISDATTNTVLDTESYSNFNGGQYAVWNLKGNVIITVTCTSTGSNNNPLISGIFFGSANSPVSTSSATYAGTDTSTAGNWTGNYGSDGYQIANDGSGALPSYASLGFTGATTYTWASPTTDTRGLQVSSGSSTRIASTYYSYQTSFQMQLNLTDGNVHRIALYMVDWGYSTRNQTISITDASTNAVLDTRSYTNFNSGQYAIWNLKGNVIITVTCTSNVPGDTNPLISGIFFGSANAAASATYTGVDTGTQGNWTGNYGSDGYQIANDTNGALPSYASLTFSNASTYTWAYPTTDTRALQVSSGSSTRIASTYYSGQASFQMHLNLADGNTHRVALYMVDWGYSNRNETISITDASTNAVLDTESYSNFNNGQYVVWNLRGNVIITVTCTSTASGDNPLVSGIFFGPATASAAAVFGGVDTSTQGSWTGKYGADGFKIANNTSNSLPSYASFNDGAASTYTWAYPTTDVRALQVSSGSSTRIASTYYSGTSFSTQLNLTDGNTHRVAFYFVDWGYSNRSQSIAIYDAVTGTLLDTETFSNFNNGEYAIWSLKGNVIITVTCLTSGPLYNPLISGLFFN